MKYTPDVNSSLKRKYRVYVDDVLVLVTYDKWSVEALYADCFGTLNVVTRRVVKNEKLTREEINLVSLDAKDSKGLIFGSRLHKNN